MLRTALHAALSTLSCVSIATGTLTALVLAGAAQQAAAADPYIWTGEVSSAWDTTTLNWTQGGQAAAFKSGGAATFAGAAKRYTIDLSSNISVGALTIEGMYSFTGQGQVTASSFAHKNTELTMGEGVVIKASGEMVVNGGNKFSSQGKGKFSIGTLTTAGVIQINSNLDITAGGSGQGSGTNTKGLNMKDGAEVSIYGGTTTVTGAVYMGHGTESVTTVASGKLVIGDGFTPATLVATRLEVGDFEKDNSRVDITVARNSRLVITGSANGSDHKTASVVLAEWKSETNLDIAGGFYARDAEMRSGSYAAGATVLVHDGAVLAVKGITQTEAATNYDISGGSKLVLGGSGIQQSGGPVSIGASEIGISASSVKITSALDFTGGDITFNTTQYTWGSDKMSLTQGATKGTIDITGSISGNGNLVVNGNGTLSLSATAQQGTGYDGYLGNTVVNGATLRVLKYGSLGFDGFGGKVTLTSGATLSVETDKAAVLDLSAKNLTYDSTSKVKVLANGTLRLGLAKLGSTIENAGTVEFSQNRTVTLDDLALQYSAAGYVDETGAESDQGFLRGATGYVEVVRGGTITVAPGARFSYNGNTDIVLDTTTGRATVSTSETTDWTRFEIHSGNHSSGDIAAYAASRGGVLETIDISGGTVHVTQNFAGVINATGGEVYVNSNALAATINVQGTDGSEITLGDPDANCTNLNVSGNSVVKGFMTATNLRFANGSSTSVQANLDAANLSVASDATVSIAGNSGYSIVARGGSVDGTVALTQAGSFRVGVFGGSGTVTVNGLVDAAAGTTVDIRQGSTMAVNGRLHLAGGANFTPNGTLLVNAPGEVIAGDGVNLGALNVKGKLSAEGTGATVYAKGGSVENLNLAAGQTLNVDGALTLQSNPGGDGNLVVSGTFTTPNSLQLDNVTAGAVALTSNAALTVDSALNTGSVTLNRINRDKVYLTAGSLTAGNTDFVVNVDAVEGLRLNDGMTLTLADIDTTLAGTVSVNGGASISKEGSDYAYDISQDALTKDIILTARERESDYIWTDPMPSQVGSWADDANWSGGNAPDADADAWVQLRTGEGTIIIDGEAKAKRMTTYSGTSHTFAGDGSLSIAGTLSMQGSTIQIGSGADTLSAQVGETRLSDGSSLIVKDGAGFSTGALISDGTGASLTGHVTVYGNGGVYRGAYHDVHVTLERRAESASINQALAADKELTVDGTAGSVTFLYDADAHLGGIDTSNMIVVLNSQTDDAVGKCLTLDSASGIAGGTLVFGLDPESTAATLGTRKAPVVLTAENGLDLTTSRLVIGQGGSYSKNALEIDTKGKTEDLVFAYVGDEHTTAREVDLSGMLFKKYYTNARLVDGAVLVDLRSGYFEQDVVPSTEENVRTGAAMLDEALKYTNPQVADPDGELARIMDALESGKLTAGGARKIAASLAGASTAALGLAASQDVDRQLRAIRNRTTTMGVGEGANRSGMPYVNAWINAEGDYRKLDKDNSLAGYKMTSWGGTLGLDVDCTPRFTCGLAVTAMYGDFTADSAERAEGDLDRTYVTGFAHYTHGSWSHTLVGTLGRFDTKLNRSINYGTETASTSGDSDGTGFGLMYELGFMHALNESRSTAIQPLFNVSWRHSSLGGYTESGSQTALRVGDVETDVVTFALGARLQSAYGAVPCNRSSLFEGRVLAKLSTGDKDAQSKVNLSGLPTHTAKSAELGGFGVEVGAGLAIPMLRDSDSLFMDLSAEFWSGYTNVNGVIGYRVNF